MPNKHSPGTPWRRNIEAERRSAAWWAAASALLALAVAGGYLGLYRAKGFRLPVGFDAPWYVWRASFLTGHGVGPLGTSTRPGSAVLAAVLGSLTGRSQFTMAVLLGPVLAGVFALAVGALVWSSMGEDRRRWLAAVAVGGTVLGATRLVDENVATLLFLCLLVAALVPLVAAAAGRGPRWAFVGSVGLLVAAGLAHWLFLAVFGVMLACAVVLLASRSLRQRSEGVALACTEAGTLASAGVVTGGVMLLAVFGVLRAPANTIQLKEDPVRFVPKLTNDASRLRLWLLGPVAALGASSLSVSEPMRSRRRAVLLALLGAWSAVALAGIAFGVITKDLPPHRFLELLIVVPGVVAMAEAVSWLAGRVPGRSGPGASWAVAAAVIALLVVPGLVAWYSSGAPRPWIDPAGLQEARAAADRAIALLPSGEPFIVLVSPFGPAGIESTALKERTIRAALPADRQADLHLFVGTWADLQAKRRMVTSNPAMNAATLPYWEDVRDLVADDHITIVVRAFAPASFTDLPADAVRIAPGTFVVHGPRFRGGPAIATYGAPLAPPESAFPGVVMSALWAAAILMLLAAAGIGWTDVLLGADAHPTITFGLSPAVGAGSLIIVGSVVSRAGVGLDGVAAWLGWALTAGAGLFVARIARRNGKATLPSDAPVDSSHG